MTAAPSSTHAHDEPVSVSRPLVLLLATACALVVANVYYAQPLIGPISAALGMSTEAAGLIVTMTQIGYVLGLFFLVPLGDLLENRRLMTSVLALCAVALLAAAFSTQAMSLLAAMLAIGLSSVVVQMLIPYSAHLAPEATRGRVVGTVTSGLMMGIMLSRPVASLITHVSAWPVVFELSAAAMATLAVVLALRLPARHPVPGLGYRALLGSMMHLARTSTVLRRRAAYQFCLYFAFSLFWTAIPLRLASPEFGLSQAGIAWFGLAAVAGAVAAPLGGTLADRGHSRLATGIGITAVAIAFPLSLAPHGGEWSGLAVLTVAAILLDFGVSFTLVNSQRAIFSLGAAFRSRLNGLFMAMFFIGGAIGSGAGAWAYARGGWAAAASLGLALPIVGLVIFATEFRRTRA